MTTTASVRQIFKFHDGNAERAVDPVVILRRMQQQPIDFAAELTVTQDAPDPKLQEESWLNLVNAVRAVFEIEPLAMVDGKVRGLTENETMDVLDAFGTFVADVKKNSSENPTSPPSSAPEPCPSSPTPPSSTNATSASC